MVEHKDVHDDATGYGCVFGLGDTKNIYIYIVYFYTFQIFTVNNIFVQFKFNYLFSFSIRGAIIWTIIVSNSSCLMQEILFIHLFLINEYKEEWHLTFPNVPVHRK